MKMILIGLGMASLLVCSASAQTMSFPIESGPDGRVDAGVGLTRDGTVTSLGLSANSASGYGGSASVTANGSASVSGNLNGFGVSVGTGPAGHSGSLSYGDGTFSGSVSSGPTGPSVGIGFGTDF